MPVRVYPRICRMEASTGPRGKLSSSSSSSPPPPAAGVSRAKVFSSVIANPGKRGMMTTVALALLESAQAFTAPAMRAPARSTAVTMFEEGDIGVLPPLGVYDPLGLIETRDMRRYEIMEIKHGRAAMLGFLHVIHLEAGVRFPGYLSGSAGLKFTDMPKGCFASLEAVPALGWLQILAVALACETGYAGRAFSVVKQTDDREPGDIGGEGWVRYDDPGEKAYKLNVERQNGRAAMMGITGCLAHEILGVDALYPTGGFGGEAPPEIIDMYTSFANFPSFVAV